MKSESKTLFFTLCARALDNKFRDTIAEAVIKKNKDLLKYRPNLFTQKLITHRAKYFDQQVISVYHQIRSRKVVLINLGGGLCSRFERINSSISMSIHLDLPEVIDLAKQILPKTSDHLVSADLNKKDWWKNIVPLIPPGAVPVFTLEGVSMYLDKNTQVSLFQDLPKYFHQGYIISDFLHPIFYQKGYLITSIQQVGANFSNEIVSLEKIIEISQLKLDKLRPPFFPFGTKKFLPFNLYQFATLHW